MTDLSYLILEMGNPQDSVALISSLHSRGGFHNVTPDDKEFSQDLDFKPSFRNLPTKDWFPGFDKAPAPVDWLKQWCTKKPWLTYLSGHYSGHLYNSADPVNFTAHFGTKGKLSVTVSGAGKTFDCGALNSGCAVVIVVGCSILSNKGWRNEMGTFLESPSGKPTLLGFYKTCPVEKQDLLVKYFVEALPASGTPSESALQSAWFSAAKKWKLVSPGFANNVGYMTSGGMVYIPDDDFNPVEKSG